ncbi:MAG: cyclic nucleotide-binding domain-containing protein [Spirochaetia bacterium]|nr:cyclic nucleotide-binding domain-containing protein [Spirochaetia bacterium]
MDNAHPERISLESIKGIGRVVSFEAGSKIYEADYLVGEPCSFLILEGEVEVTKSYTPLQKDVFLYGKGEVFGMLEVYVNTARLTDARALTAVQAIGFSRNEFERAMAANLGFALTCIRLLSKMLRQVNHKLKHM